MTATEGEVKEGGRIYESLATNAIETGGKFTASVTAINVYTTVNLRKDATINVVDTAGTIVTSGQQCRRCDLSCEYLCRMRMIIVLDLVECSNKEGPSVSVAERRIQSPGLIYRIQRSQPFSRKGR